MIVCKNSDWLQKFRNCPRLTAIIRKRHTQFRGKVHHPVPGAPSSEGKCTKLAAKWFTFPESVDKNGNRANISGGKCRRFAAIWFTFPGKKGEMAVKSTFSAGRCTKKAGKWFTSPRQNEKIFFRKRSGIAGRHTPIRRTVFKRRLAPALFTCRRLRNESAAEV